ncbi:MAG: biotin--[acetyl-CoA-carboxylase] ligase [Anaerorhabdus sp.]
MKLLILKMLEENMHEFTSGEVIAKKFGMTRANVWKNIQKLINDGYKIESVSNKGYHLVDYNTNISKSRISTLTNNKVTIEYLESVDSTNNYAKEIVKDSDISNHIVISDQQTMGKGRNGRSFYSPSKNGIYMSFILRPQLTLLDTQLLTIAAAVAVVESIKELYEVDTDIKWLNDIYYQNKKLCGILTEGEIILESNSYRYVIVGIGLNVFNDQNLPKELQNIYSSLDTIFKGKIDRNILVATIINNFYELYNNLLENKTFILEKYRNSSIVLDKYITINNDLNKKYLVIDIDDYGHLIVKDESDEIITLNSGDVSIKGDFNNEH